MKKPTKAELKAVKENYDEGLVGESADWIEMRWQDYNREIQYAFVAGMRVQKGREKKNMFSKEMLKQCLYQFSLDTQSYLPKDWVDNYLRWLKNPNDNNY